MILLLVLVQTVGIQSLAAATNLPASISSLIKKLPDDTKFGLVVLGSNGEKLFDANSELELPTASTVKPRLLLELFSKFDEELDKTSRPDIAQVVNDPSHPAILYFSQDVRDRVKTAS